MTIPNEPPGVAECEDNDCPGCSWCDGSDLLDDGTHEPCAGGCGRLVRVSIEIAVYCSECDE